MLKPLNNQFEHRTQSILLQICERRSLRLIVKIRLSDVLDVDLAISRDEISPAQHRFATQSHYDFVIYDLNEMPMFAVEFDGSQHAGPIQAARDAMKNELSRHFGLCCFRVTACDLWPSHGSPERLTSMVDDWFAGTPPSLPKQNSGCMLLFCVLVLIPLCWLL